MISLVPLGDVPAQATPAAQSEVVKKIQVQAISMRDALVLGIVTGFALAIGNMFFDKLSKKFHWKR